jgi:hypothetical protein
LIAASVRILLTAAVIVTAAVASSARPLDARQASPLEILDVPYLPQSEALCGGAAAAMVMRYWGATGVYATSFADLVRPEAGGIRGDDLLRALEARGWDARSFRGDASLVRSHLAKRRPIVALIEVRPGTYHYVVLVSWPDGRVLLHDPARAPFRVMTEADFVRAWEAAGFWTMLVVPGRDAVEKVPAESKGPPPSDLPAPCAGLVDEGVRLAGTGDAIGARRLFEIAADACPLASGPWREMAGLHALRGAWREAAADARRATELDAGDRHAWRILATASYLQDDPLAALDAWNRIDEPRVDIVSINGLERTRYAVAARTIDIPPHTLLTAVALERARRRLAELPSAQTARVVYRPGENGLAQLDAVVIERPMVPTSRTSLAATGVHLVSDRELTVAIASPAGGGELWTVAWRWWERRPRVALAFSAPAPFGGVWRVEAFDERQTYGSSAASFAEGRRGAAAGLADWFGAATRWEATIGIDRWREHGRAASLGAGIERHLSSGRLVASTRAASWIGDVDTWTASARVDWRSATRHEGDVWLARTGISAAGADAPLALWPAAGTGQRADVMLRAHPVVRSGRVDDAVFGRRLVHAGGEWRRWLQPIKRVLRIAPAAFVDIGRATRAGAFSDTRTHVDVGMGLRFVLPGSGVLGLDIGRGLRDGETALSIGWRR